MDWLDAMNQAVDYLEEHINEKLDMEKIAKIALSSPFHFQRMYHMITGITVAEYLRRRRLTLAAQDILSGEKIIDVAYRYGYESPESFTKAFRKMYGFPPSAARDSGVRLKAYPKLSFHISIKGAQNMDYTIVEKKGFSVVGKQSRITMADGQNFKQVPDFWYRCMEDGTSDYLCSKIGKLGILGVCKDFTKDEFNYMIAVENQGEKIPDGYIKADVPAATWAIFESVGALPKAVQDLTQRIYTEWFPATGYQHDCAPELEVYPLGDTDSDEYRCEIWVPIKK